MRTIYVTLFLIHLLCRLFIHQKGSMGKDGESKKTNITGMSGEKPLILKQKFI